CGRSSPARPRTCWKRWSMPLPRSPGTTCGAGSVTAGIRSHSLENCYRASLHEAEVAPGGYQRVLGHTILTWQLKPQSSAKPFPNYIPAPVRQDYEEACLICSLSPKASATLARRCLQGTIRDFWGIQKPRLIDEIKDLEGKVDSETWKAIDAVRSIGNIGAHMEKDINLIIDVDQDEAKLLLSLIEILLQEWYIRRHERESHMQKVIVVAQSKIMPKEEAKS
ncbi:MAG: DUF4145 domain-containing protein, partial [Deltaproteobacteria bacterium]|nr:DUF4145 domain-containing protein [Deltaproteobacteria bacterium]